ncbi:hypothetical protein Ahy_A03g012743 [Arachis hypogaea]|uniref:Uncharacterized protein n=1 Tax=Arachis hypogaea TaxID=3818 RepID=A0A445DU14_ARAHY|nr:hypothetical protein Ahy_A03g012743 [Arachis hypogaea]
MPGRQNLIFADDDKILDIVDKKKYKDTMFTAWMRANVKFQDGEIFYMRLLLNVQRDCRSFESIRTVDGVLYDSFKDAYNALGLLIDDPELINAIKETAELSSGF